MDINVFISTYREAFGEAAELPIVFWFSDEPVADTKKTGGCFFKGMAAVRQGTPISLSEKTVACMGGKLYTGFAGMSERIPDFVSLKEKYKQTPEMVREFVDSLGMPRNTQDYLNFARIDKVERFDKMEGVLFFATPDMLSGLATWAYFDNNSNDAVTAMFGSGCSAIVTNAVVENGRNGRRTFLGLFDPSVRPFVEANVLSFVIPMSRFKEMYHTMRSCCLFGTHAWQKVRDRINGVSEPHTKTPSLEIETHIRPKELASI